MPSYRYPCPLEHLSISFTYCFINVTTEVKDWCAEPAQPCELEKVREEKKLPGGREGARSDTKSPPHYRKLVSVISGSPAPSPLLPAMRLCFGLVWPTLGKQNEVGDTSLLMKRGCLLSKKQLASASCVHIFFNERTKSGCLSC